MISILQHIKLVQIGNPKAPRSPDRLYLVGWRVWFARNKITHDKPLPPIEGSKRFLCSYLQTLRDINDISTEQILKDKQPLILPGDQTRIHLYKVKPPDKSWYNLLQAGCAVWLTVDGSFHDKNSTAGTGMILRDETGQVIFSACRFLPSCEEPFEVKL
jgi:hypothetical protein